MVKFGRHLQFYLDLEYDESEGSHSHYIVPYNNLKDKYCAGTFSCSNAKSISLFQEAWRESLKLASADYCESTTSCWQIVFESTTNIPQARGATLDSALKLFPPTCGVTASRDLLCFLKNIHSAASLNSEGLRKLVKKFDKQMHAHTDMNMNTNTSMSNSSPSSSLSHVLLPELYSSNFFMGLQALDAAIATLRALLDDLDSDEQNSDADCYEHKDKDKHKYMYGEEKKTSNSYYEHDTVLANVKTNTVETARRTMNIPISSMNERKRQNETYTYVHEELMMGKRANEIQWLKGMTQQIPEEEIRHVVAHRGFHNPKENGDKRPIENSLAAFEVAWTNGVHICECDVALTKDEKIVMAHDSDFSRLSLIPSSDPSNRTVSELTFRELLALTLKNGVRAPLLLEVLHSAHSIGPHAKLIIEIKPGNNQAAMALARLLGRHPEFVPHVAAIMSFDLWAMHELRGALERALPSPSFLPLPVPPSLSSSPIENIIECTDILPNVSMPKLMLLTVAHPPIDHHELWVDVNNYEPIDEWLNTDDTTLDGVYVRYEPKMMNEGAAELKKLCDKYIVGVWGMFGEDPDDYETMHYLVKECGVSFFNTDLPLEFLSKPACTRILDNQIE